MMSSFMGLDELWCWLTAPGGTHGFQAPGRHRLSGAADLATRENYVLWVGAKHQERCR
jgi:hypothetical protein